jgi:pantoate--beta-alanine ligase
MQMEIIDTAKDMQSLNRRLRSEGLTIGFVPTMGALHEGHLSLVRQSLADNDITAVSTFVNPTQFSPGEDYEKYPRETGADLDKLTALNVDAVFIPPANEMYREEGSSITVNVGPVGRVLCGVSRPGHFNGVATVVAKLFNIVLPDRSYFGQKDFQQTVIIKKLARDLNFDIDIIVCPTVREQDGQQLFKS